MAIGVGGILPLSQWMAHLIPHENEASSIRRQTVQITARISIDLYIKQGNVHSLICVSDVTSLSTSHPSYKSTKPQTVPPKSPHQLSLPPPTPVSKSSPASYSSP